MAHLFDEIRPNRIYKRSTFSESVSCSRHEYLRKDYTIPHTQGRVLKVTERYSKDFFIRPVDRDPISPILEDLDVSHALLVDKPISASPFKRSI